MVYTYHQPGWAEVIKAIGTGVEDISNARQNQLKNKLEQAKFQQAVQMQGLQSSLLEKLIEKSKGSEGVPTKHEDYGSNIQPTDGTQPTDQVNDFNEVITPKGISITDTNIDRIQPTTPKDTLPYSDDEILLASFVNPVLSKAMASSNQQVIEQRKFDFRQKEHEETKSFRQKQLDQQQSLALTKLNEPYLKSINDKLQKTEQSISDFNALDQIFTESSDKLPTSWAAALFDLDSEKQLSKLARSSISPEAQRVIKIVTNQLRGARDTFGANVTNFESSTYLRGLPGLLNTTEGKKRIVRDLGIVNRINKLKEEAVLEEFEKAGGSDKITYSTAESRAKKAIKPQVDMLREMYENPNKRDFYTAPDASLMRGEELIDEETGQRFQSNGKEWIPIP